MAMKMHPSITEERVSEAARRRRETLDNPGFCVGCGAEVGGCEPDAEYNECEACSEREVFGAEQLLLLMIF